MKNRFSLIPLIIDRGTNEDVHCAKQNEGFRDKPNRQKIDLHYFCIKRFVRNSFRWGIDYVNVF